MYFRGNGAGALGDVVERVDDQICNVLIRKGIQDMLALTSSFHQILAAQNPEALGDGGDLLILGPGEVGDAERAVPEQEEEAKTGDISQSAKDVGGAVEGGVELFGQSAGRVEVGLAGVSSFRQNRHMLSHLNTCSSDSRIVNVAAACQQALFSY